MWNSVISYGIRVLLYLANLFIIASFLILLITHFTSHLNSIEYYATTKSIRISLLVLTAFSIFLSSICIRRSNIPKAVYEFHIAFLFIVAIFSAHLLIFNFDKTESIQKELIKDIAKFNNETESKPISRLDYIQKMFRCCGLDSPNDYINQKPNSCEIQNVQKKNGSMIKNHLNIPKMKEYASKFIEKDDGDILYAKNRRDLEIIKRPTNEKTKQDGRNNALNLSIYQRDLENDEKIKTMTEPIKDEKDSDEKANEEETYFKKGCWKILENDHFDIKDTTKKLCIIIISSSISAAFITYILFLTKEGAKF